MKVKTWNKGMNTDNRFQKLYVIVNENDKVCVCVFVGM